MFTVLDSEPETNGTTDTQPSIPAKATTSSPQAVEPTPESEAIKIEPAETKEKSPKKEETTKTDSEEEKVAEAKVESEVEAKAEVKDEEMDVDEEKEKEKEPEKDEEEVKPKEVEKEKEKPKEVEKEKEKVKEKEKEKPKEKDPVDEEAILRQKTQINQRELFLSKQVEILPANNIRGKCCVTLLNETESFSSYIDKDVWFIVVLKNILVSGLTFPLVIFLGCVFLHLGLRSSAANSAS